MVEDYRQQIEAALEHAGGTHTFEDVAERIADGRMQFWPGVKAAIVTEILNYPRLKALNFFLAGGVGGLSEIEAMTPGILEWGRSVGCTQAVFTGRKGWERTFLTRTGWETKLVVFEKQL